MRPALAAQSRVEALEMQADVSLAGRDRPLTVRDFAFAPDARTPRHWMNGDAFETHLLNALSLVFPPGERFFIRSVRALQHHVTSEALLAQVRDFVAQEGRHSREHRLFNEWIGRLGLPADIIERRVEERIAARSGKRKPMDNLAVTCALEHFTAVMAKFLLTTPEFQAHFDQAILPLWVWHALEELDHKAVAFDVYEAAKGGYTRRVTAMAGATIGLLSSTLVIQWHLMRRDKKHRDVLAYAKGLLRYLGPGGYAQKILPDYLTYYRRDYHPWQNDDRPLMEAAEQRLKALLARRN
jgi:predicted metal-dependent hydrolase